MTTSATIRDQYQPAQRLNALFENSTIPHALLFTGVAGVGKLAVARAFAMTCNCTEITADRGADPSVGRESPPSSGNPSTNAPLPSCGQCSSCRKIINGSHPDILHIEPAGRNIKIAQIRDLIDTLSMKPYEARLRVVLIAEAHSLNLSAGNALLKMLEEPPDRTLLILTAPQKADVLPTIVSRCQMVPFRPVSRRTITAELCANHDISPEDAAVLSNMACGSISRATELHRSGWLKYRDWLLDASGLEKIEKIDTRPIAILLGFAEKLFSRKAQVAISLETMLIWLRDLIVCRHDPAKVVNTDLIDKLRKVSQKIPEPALIKKMEIIQTAQRNIEANANLRLALEAMMLKLARS